MAVAYRDVTACTVYWSRSRRASDIYVYRLPAASDKCCFRCLQADLIPSRNAAKLTALGTAKLRSKWRSLFEVAGNVDDTGIVDMADRPGPKADH